MLTAADKAKLKALGIDADALAKVVSDPAEVAFTVNGADGKPVSAIPDGKVYSDADISTLTDNIKRDHGGESAAAMEIMGRKLNKDHSLGLSNADTKDLGKVVAAMQAKAVKDAGIEPDKKVKELQDDIAKLQKTITDKDGEIGQHKTRLQEREEFDAYRSEIEKHNPDKRLETKWHIARVKDHVKRGEKGEAINPETGEAFKDNLQNAIKFSDKVAELFKQPGWSEPPAATTTGGKFHHGTGSASTGGASLKVDAGKIAVESASNFDMTTQQGRAAHRAHVTQQTLAANKTGV